MLAAFFGACGVGLSFERAVLALRVDFVEADRENAAGTLGTSDTSTVDLELHFCMRRFNDFLLRRGVAAVLLPVSALPALRFDFTEAEREKVTGTAGTSGASDTSAADLELHSRTRSFKDFFLRRGLTEPSLLSTCTVALRVSGSLLSDS